MRFKDVSCNAWTCNFEFEYAAWEVEGSSLEQENLENTTISISSQIKI